MLLRFALGSVQVVPAFEQVSYIPDLLLPLPTFDVRLLHDKEFVVACEYGYNDYFEMMYEEDEGGRSDAFVFVHHAYTFAEVAQYMHDNLRVVPLPSCIPASSLAWRAGFVFGWLSALAHYDHPLAVFSVAFFEVAVKLLQGAAYA